MKTMQRECRARFQITNSENSRRYFVFSKSIYIFFLKIIIKKTRINNFKNRCLDLSIHQGESKIKVK